MERGEMILTHPRRCPEALWIPSDSYCRDEQDEGVDELVTPLEVKASWPLEERSIRQY
jgi:hypothetical protein